MLGVATNPIPIKTAMKLLGRGTGELRLPLCPLDAAGEAKVRQTLVAYGFCKMEARSYASEGSGENTAILVDNGNIRLTH